MEIDVRNLQFHTSRSERSGKLGKPDTQDDFFVSQNDSFGQILAEKIQEDIAPVNKVNGVRPTDAHTELQLLNELINEKLKDVVIRTPGGFIAHYSPSKPTGS